MQVAVPECLPERLEVLAYASEIGFLYDDITEEYSEEKLDAANKLMEDTFKDCIEHDRPIGNKLKGLEIIQSSLFDEMRSIDEPRALVALGHWSSFLSEGAGRQHQSQFKGLDEYMDYRIRDVGEMFWLGLVTFGMGLDIPDAELTTIRELTRSCWVALCLQNDLCSYWKEAKDATDRGSTKVVNALPVIMEELKVDLDGAREMCRSFLEDQLAEYQQVVEEHKENLNLSQDSRTYLEALLFTISGDAAWSLISPRYNYQLNGRVQTA
ncbi:hypothetical protein G7054_g10180 [Neopestalotiopsis clavispora]|nr:hypothetical protein G7054_g10180 [Neopestalotiopsis clavispora]